MPDIGEVNETRDGFEWRINNFLDLSAESYYSPEFSYNNEPWGFRIFLNGSSENNSVGYVDLRILKNRGSSIKVQFSFALKSVNGEKYAERHYTETFKAGGDFYTYPRFISRSELVRKESELLPSGILTVVWSLNIPQSACENDSKAKKCFCCKETLGADCISIHEKCIDRPIKCPDCFDVILLQNWLHGHECQKDRTKDDGSLCEDLKNVLLDGSNHDLILKVGDKKLRAHQDILKARSKVFKSMLNHDMTEKNHGVIDVPDCDPQAMEVFLSYVYCGKVETLDQNNMIGLYYIADKYDMQNLKESCSDFIKKSLSPVNVCDVIQLAINHSDSSLLEFTTEYFTNNVLDILSTVEWQSFMKDNSTVANELFIKSYKKKT